MIHVDIVLSQDPVVVYYGSNDEGQKVGYCLIGARVLGETKEAVIYHLHVDEQYRRKGYGKDLLEALKVHYHTVVSQGLTPEGRKCMLSAGFVRDGANFRWTKVNGVNH